MDKWSFQHIRELMTTNSPLLAAQSASVETDFGSAFGSALAAPFGGPFEPFPRRRAYGPGLGARLRKWFEPKK
jgi:hypothetical protein